MFNTEYLTLHDDFKDHLGNIYQKCQVKWLTGEPEFLPQLSSVKESNHYAEFMSSFYDSNFREFNEDIKIVFVRSPKYEYSFDVCVYVNNILFDSIHIGYADTLQAEQAKAMIEKFLSNLVKRKAEIKAKIEKEKLHNMFTVMSSTKKRHVL